MTTYKFITCPKCGTKIKTYSNPVPTVDIIIELGNKIVLIERKNPPLGLAIPGGFVDYGETVEDAAIREAMEETGLKVRLKYLIGVYSNPARDARMHTISTAFAASGSGHPRAGDDAAAVKIVEAENMDQTLCFDHASIIRDYLKKKRRGGCG